MRTERPPAVVVRGEQPAQGVEGARDGTRQAGAGAATRESPKDGAAGYGSDGTASERPTDPSEVVSVCGARTKKGTPCSRRVRGTGRCWQHRGLPAMLPPEKLIVSN